ncbi:MAG: hypothetical protein ACI4WS_09490 [Oscillospiraceae bacterium]
MNKYKIGDKVRVRKDLEARKIYGTNGFSKSMEKYRGKVVTIFGFNPFCTREYKIREDDGDWNWTDEMFEPVQNEEITITRHGDKVVAKYVKKVGVAKCSPDDTFDFAVGAKLAFSRLMGEPEDKPEPKPKFKIGEYVKVISNTRPLHSFPLGSIVTIKNLIETNSQAVCYGLTKANGKYCFRIQVIALNDIEHLPENTHAD